MFIKEVTLKRNGLSSQLIHFVFPWAPVFNNYCPHFWLTILSGLLFLPIAIIRGIWICFKVSIRGVGAAIEGLADFMEASAARSLESRLFSLSPEDIAKFLAWDRSTWLINGSLPLPACEIKRFQKIGALYHKLRRKVNENILGKMEKQAASANFDTEAWKKELFARQEAWEAKQKLIEKRRKEKLQSIEKRARAGAIKLIGVAKVVTVVVIIPLGLFLAYKLCLFIGWICYWIAYCWTYWFIPHFIAILEACAIVAGLIVATIIFIYAVKGIIKLISLIPFGGIARVSWICVVTQKLKYVFRELGKGLQYGALAAGTWLVHYAPKFASGAGSFFSFFWMMFKAWKSKNCPAIIWKD